MRRRTSSGSVENSDGVARPRTFSFIGRSANKSTSGSRSGNASPVSTFRSRAKSGEGLGRLDISITQMIPASPGGNRFRRDPRLRGTTAYRLFSAYLRRAERRCFETYGYCLVLLSSASRFARGILSEKVPKVNPVCSLPDFPITQKPHGKKGLTKCLA